MTMSFNNRNRNAGNTQALASALAQRDETPIYTQPIQVNNTGGNNEDNGIDLIGLGSTAASFLPYGNIASGTVNGAGAFAQSGDYKDGLQGMFGVDKDSSDVKQGINGTLNGAKMGMSFGPIGAAVGAALGLGSSFLDDI